MEIVYFNTIKDFIKIKEKCPFCKINLTPILTDYNGGKYLPRVNSKLTNDNFIFNFEYYSRTFNVQTKVIVNIIDNSVYFKEANSYDVVDLFESIVPYIQLSCENKLCKMKYYCASSIFHFILDNDNKITISPICFMAESCSNNNLCVYSYPADNISHIFTKKCSTPIQTQYLDFELYGKEKLLSRVKTLIVFS